MQIWIAKKRQMNGFGLDNLYNKYVLKKISVSVFLFLEFRQYLKRNTLFYSFCNNYE
jgi:hypothetical protein